MSKQHLFLILIVYLISAVGSMKRFSALRGMEAGTQYAEGFRQHLGHGFPQDNILTEIQGILVINR